VSEEHIDYQILENHNCARAIAAHYFREKWMRVEKK
jgi:hypothetical protein